MEASQMTEVDESQSQSQRLNFFKPDQSKEKLQDKFNHFTEKIRKDKRTTLIARKRLCGLQTELIKNGSSNSIIINGEQPLSNHDEVLQLLNKLMSPQNIGSKDKLQYIRELRVSLTLQQNEETYQQLIQKGGISLLSNYLSENNQNQYIKEEAIWSLTNLSIYSSIYEQEFAVAVQALMEIMKCDKVDNLGSLLNLKQQCIQALGNFAIDSELLRNIIAGENGLGIKMIIDLIFFSRAQLSEQCFWTLNNFLLSDKSFSQICILHGACKAILNVFEKVKTKTPELMTEMLWTLDYLLDFNQECNNEVLSQIPNLITRLTNELDNKLSSPVNRPILRILGNLISYNTEFGNNIMYDEKFETFFLEVLFNQENNLYKKECLWILSNVLASSEEHNYEFILENKNLLEQLIILANDSDYQIKKEALVTLYNLCENHENKNLQKVMSKDPSPAFFNVIQNYYTCDPYLLKIALSFCSLICEKYGESAINNIYQSGINEMIENIQYKFSENEELVMMVQSFLDKYLYCNDNQGAIDVDTNNNIGNNQVNFNI